MEITTALIVTCLCGIAYFIGRIHRIGKLEKRVNDLARRLKD